MSLKRPLIATHISGFSDFTIDKHNAFLVQKACPEELAAAMENILSNPDLAKKISMNAKKDAAQYSADNFARSFEVLYEKLLHDKK